MRIAALACNECNTSAVTITLMESLPDIVNLGAVAKLQPNDAANHRRLGGALLSIGRAAEAADALRRAIELDPRSVRAHNNLGHALLQCGEISAAIRHFETSLALDPHYAIGHNNIGLALTAAGDYERAIAAFQRALDIAPALLVATLNLAIAFERLGNLQRALSTYEQLLALAPRHADALTCHAALCAKLHRPQAALESLDAVLQLRPQDAVSLTLRAAVLLASDRAAEALLSVDQALQLRDDFTEALNIKAGALWKLNRTTEALRCIDRALDLDPKYVDGWCTGALLHQSLGDQRSAADSYRRALSMDAGRVIARVGLLAVMIPTVPASSREDGQSRAAFDLELTEFESWLRQRELAASDAWLLARQQLFYLSYQEHSNTDFLRRYRGASSRRLSAFSPSSGAGTTLGTAHGRMRLGFVSAHVFDHSVYGAIMQGWLAKLDPNKFEMTIFCLGSKRDERTLQAGTLVDHFEDGARSPADWADLIRRRNLDALIFPEVGMDPATLALAHLRLAPHQYAAWGHPETTGLPTIDYFLSAQALEPPAADEHYSEKLIRLPNLGVYYRPFGIAPAAVDFAQLGISEHGPVFVCAGTPFKYRPEHDSVWVEIARRTGNCTFVFFNHEKAELSAKLRARVCAAFESAGLDSRRHLAWIPWLPRPAFLGLLRQADVYLDSIGFSGFNTALQAVEVQLPAVTYEGRFMRGRLGSGILRQLRLPELVAASRAEYVDIAVRLAQSSRYRDEMRAKIKSVEHLAYADVGAVEALAGVLLDNRSA
jgi:protein O-GlcNAc transferase